ncbi:MAG TPA: redox-sensing transcriptional repressor Rex [Thermoanaerobaculia bacterium]|nr:redox-sensing transcriptional repressor Rex [Thermoanaerobaculia bacterium]
MTTDSAPTSPATLNRLSVYLRSLETLRREGVPRVSSQELAERFQLSPAQIRKDLAQFGEFGVRGVGYDVADLAARLTALLGLDRRQRLLIVGMGNLGSALARYPGFNDKSFQVVAGVDRAPQRIGKRVAGVTIESFEDLRGVVERSGAEIGVLTVPAEAAQQAYDRLADAGIRAVLNFAPTALQERSGVRLKNVDLRIHLEELTYFLASLDA